MTPNEYLIWGGLMLGLAFGALAQATGFCLAGGLRDCWLNRQPARIAGFLIALAAALLGTQVLAAAGLIDLGRSLYWQPGFSWLLVPLGGLLFGYGMMLARGCGARALVLLGEGNLRSLVVLLCLGIAAQATIGGILAPLRLPLAALDAVQYGGPPSLSDGLLAVGLAPPVAGLGPAIVLAALLGWLALRAARLHRQPLQLLSLAGIGLLIPAGWLLTGYLAADEFEPVPLQSLSFVAPVGDAIQYLMLATGMRLDFGLAVVAGVALGAFVAALLRGRLALRGFEHPAQLVRALLGGTMMGIGGVLALGCSIGQGLSGLSSLALSSIVACGGILLGAWLALSGPMKLTESTGEAH